MTKHMSKSPLITSGIPWEDRISETQSFLAIGKILLASEKGLLTDCPSFWNSLPSHNLTADNCRLVVWKMWYSAILFPFQSCALAIICHKTQFYHWQNFTNICTDLISQVSIFFQVGQISSLFFEWFYGRWWSVSTIFSPQPLGFHNDPIRLLHIFSDRCWSSTTNQISWKPCGFFNEAHGPR